ncbi:sperm-associated antigen 4 protein-like [Pluvialis apricaria]
MFTFDMEKEPTQTFPLQNKLPRAFHFIRIVVESNWGNSGYTCIYRVQGVDEEGEERLLGMFTFDMEKEPTQTFPLQNKLPRAFHFIRIVVQSNWGNSGYTCIYRVQVQLKELVRELKSECVCGNLVALRDEQAPEVQQLRKVVTYLAEEASRVKKELQDMRMAMSAMPLEDNIRMSAWVLKSAGVTIDLQRSPRSYTWPCSVFWFLCDLNHLDTFVQLDISPGYCWHFQASRSQVDMRLPAQVQPTAITLQHPLRKTSALGDISSAPRDFTVSGVDEEGEESLLGMFTFDIEKEPTQTFPLQNKLPRAFHFIRIVVESNWGNSGYTCIYRVQVHGRITGRMPPARLEETFCLQNRK